MRPRSRPSGRLRSVCRQDDGPPRIRAVIERYCLQPSKMNTLKRLGIALWRTLLDQGDLIAMQVLLPPVAGAISKHVRLAVTGAHIPHEGPSRLASYRQAVTRTVHGAALRSLPWTSSSRRPHPCPVLPRPGCSAARLASHRQAVTRTVDGAVLDG